MRTLEKNFNLAVSERDREMARLGVTDIFDPRIRELQYAVVALGESMRLTPHCAVDHEDTDMVYEYRGDPEIVVHVCPICGESVEFMTLEHRMELLRGLPSRVQKIIR